MSFRPPAVDDEFGGELGDITFSTDSWNAKKLATTHYGKAIVWDLKAKNPAETAFVLQTNLAVRSIVFQPKMPSVVASAWNSGDNLVHILSWKQDPSTLKWPKARLCR